MIPSWSRWVKSRCRSQSSLHWLVVCPWLLGWSRQKQILGRGSFSQGVMTFWGIELLSTDEFQCECRRKYHQRCSTYTFVLSRLFKRLQSINIASLRNSPLTVCHVPDARRRTPRNSLLCALRPALYTLQISLFSTWSMRLCSKNWDVKTTSLSRLTGNDWFPWRPPETVTFTS